MNFITHFFEPNRLLLVWQSPDGEGVKRSRREVAEIVKTQEGNILFRYLVDSADFKLATEDGFLGFPAFDLSKTEHTQGVIDTFVRRLPPRKREDFGKYLNTYMLPENFSGSDMALLAYTGARLPGDGFEIIPDLKNVNLPVEFMVEVAGFRYQTVPIVDLHVDAIVNFSCDKKNEHDSNAIAVSYKNRRIGFVPRPLLESFNKWILGNKVTAKIVRLNGKTERPLVFLLVKVG